MTIHNLIRGGRTREQPCIFEDGSKLYWDPKSYGTELESQFGYPRYINGNPFVFGRDSRIADICRETPLQVGDELLSVYIPPHHTVDRFLFLTGAPSDMHVDYTGFTFLPIAYTVDIDTGTIVQTAALTTQAQTLDCSIAQARHCSVAPATTDPTKIIIAPHGFGYIFGLKITGLPVKSEVLTRPSGHRALSISFGTVGDIIKPYFTEHP